MNKYVKVRFTSKKHGATAGLILAVDKLAKMTVSELSRLFPYSEAVKMERVEKSPEYPTWDDAFCHTYDSSSTLTGSL